MTGNNIRRSSLTPVFYVLPLLLLLAILSGAVISAGSEVYAKITRSMDDNYLARISLSYIAEKIRQGDSEGCVSIQQLGGTDCLVIEEKEWLYYTCIYYNEGYICESLVEYLEDFDPSMGERVIKAEVLELSGSEGVINIGVSDGGGKSSVLYIALRSRGTD